jgi:hypothetical protein
MITACSLYGVMAFNDTNLPVVLYGCEIWSLTLRKEHRLRAFANRAIKKIVISNRKEVIGG